LTVRYVPNSHKLFCRTEVTRNKAIAALPFANVRRTAEATTITKGQQQTLKSGNVDAKITMQLKKILSYYEKQTNNPEISKERMKLMKKLMSGAESKSSDDDNIAIDRASIADAELEFTEEDDVEDETS